MLKVQSLPDRETLNSASLFAKQTNLYMLKVQSLRERGARNSYAENSEFAGLR